MNKGNSSLNSILIVTRNMKAGGAERVIAQIANHMSKVNIQCTIVTLDDEEVFYQLDSKVILHSIGEKSSNPYQDKLLKYHNLRYYVKEVKPDIVLAMPEEIGIYVIPALLGIKIPVVVSERNNPWVMPWKKVTRIMRKAFYPFADGFIFQTKQAASFFPKKIQNKGVILPNPLDIKRIPARYKGEKRKEIVGAGRLEKQKNFPLLIKSFAKFYKENPDYNLIIYGEGSLRTELEDLASLLLPKEVYSFPGRTTELLERIRGATMFVLSSDFEGMPNVVIEAMAMGMPVISTNCPSGGPAELIQNGVNGVLTSVGDINEMYEAMIKVAQSEEYAQYLGKNAEKVKEKLNSNDVIEKWRNYLNQCSKL